MKRTDYLSWDEYFMGIAMLSAQRSKDPSTQVGACIANADHKILSVGYNGMPIGCSDDEMPWQREGSLLDTKYAYVCHAELNAILNNDGGSLKGTTIYVTLFPCHECANRASRRIFQYCGVKLRQYVPSGKKLNLEF